MPRTAGMVDKERAAAAKAEGNKAFKVQECAAALCLYWREATPDMVCILDGG